jgi:hypothetical protein
MTELERLLLGCVRWTEHGPDADPAALAVLGDWVEENRPFMLTFFQEVLAFVPGEKSEHLRKDSTQLIGSSADDLLEEHYREFHFAWQSRGVGSARMIIGVQVMVRGNRSEVPYLAWLGTAALDEPVPLNRRAGTLAARAERPLRYARWQAIAYSLGYPEARLLACRS